MEKETDHFRNLSSANLLTLLAFTLALWLGITVAQAQIFPVQSTTQLVPPYSVYLSDYAEPGNEKLRVILVQRDLTQPSYALRLVMRVELNGQLILRTSRTFNPPPIHLNAGIPTIISGGELAPYLDSRNIDFVGYSRSEYERTRALPEGSYQITFTAYDYRRQDVQVSNAGASFYYLAKSEPPLINYPACGSAVPLRTPQQIMFSWLARNTSSPNSASNTQYEFSLYETRPPGRNPNDVVLSTPPVFKTTVALTQLVYGPGEPLLLDGLTYVWRVRAIDPKGTDAFRNNGYSEVCSFTYGGINPNVNIGVVKNLQAQGETEHRAKIWWAKDDVDSYRVHYRKSKGDWDWFYSDVTTESLKASAEGFIKLFDLEADVEYETRIQARTDGFFGPYSDVVKFKMPPHRIEQCGDQSDDLPEADMSRPLLSATVNMTIDVDGIDMILTVVEPLGNGWFKGDGQVAVPFLGGTYGAKFDRLFIDADHVTGDGRINFITSSTAQMLQQQAENQKKNAGEEVQQQNREAWNGTDFYEKIFQYDALDIETVTADNASYITVTDAQSNTTINTQVMQALNATPTKAMIVGDKNGDQWVVQKDKATGQTKVTKVEGGGLQPGLSTTTTSQEPVKDRLVAVILEQLEAEIGAWLRTHGKGGEDDDEVLLAAELPTCFNKDIGQLTYIQERTIPYYKDHPAALRVKIESNPDNNKLFTRIAGLFKNADAVSWTKVSADDQEVATQATCTSIMDVIAPLAAFYEKTKEALNDSDHNEALRKIKAIYEFFNTCQGEGWESYNGEGMVPYCLWRDQNVSSAAYYSNADLPFTAGLIDGAYREAEGVYNLPKIAGDLSKIPGKLLKAYTTVYLKCNTGELMASVDEYEYVLEQLTALEETGGVWDWIKKKWYEGKQADLEKDFTDCEEMMELRKGVEELYTIISSWDEIKSLYAEVTDKIDVYFKSLGGTSNIQRYGRGRFTVTAASTALAVGSLIRIPEIRAILKGLKNATETQWKRFGEELKRLANTTADDIAEGLSKGADDLVGTYTTTIKWGTKTVEARRFGKGYWGKRFPQNNPRVDAYELKINPKNESYYLPLSEERMVQFENISKEALQDGKLIMEQSSIYHVYDKPPVLRVNILSEAKDQAAVAKKHGLKVEWLVSDEKAVDHLTRFFKEENVDIMVRLFSE